MYRCVLAVWALGRGLWTTWQHVVRCFRAKDLVGLRRWTERLPLKGIVTLRYPKERLSVPDHGRNQLHNEIDDCIVCDKCARVCPVDCIDIEAIRSPDLIGYTSDGTPKRLYAARFDIDMAKCCFCGLCTVVCPTECLSMQSIYDYSTDQVARHTLSFSTLSEAEIAAHKARWASHINEKNRNR